MIAKSLRSKVQDTIDAAHLQQLLAEHLAGSPADGAEPHDERAHAVVWVDRGDEVIVHLDSVRTKLGNGIVLVGVDLETDQTGRQTLVVPFAASEPKQGGGLAMTVETLPRGHEALARRWGPTLIDAVFSAFQAIIAAHAQSSQTVPRALHIEGNTLCPRPVTRP